MNCIKFKKLHPEAKIPERKTKQSAGFDLYSVEDKIITGGDGCFLVKTGIAVCLPNNCYGRIAMRSGLAINEHLCVSGGVIDLDYIGEICVIVYCSKIGHNYTISKGERFAQLIPELVNYYDQHQMDSSPEKHDGFGSSGKF